jgi:hypothetical protein
MSKLIPRAFYVLGTVLMGFGWLCAMAQGDAPKGNEGVSSIVAIFTIAVTLLVFSSAGARRMTGLTKYLLLAIVGTQAAFCLFAVITELSL